MVDLDWCKKQKSGIKLIEPNQNLAEEYIRNAEETLIALKEIDGKSNIWSATMKYYFEYFCFYAVLMKVGIKCEIHECTLEVCRLLETIEVLPEGISEVLEKDKALRLDNQYYLKNKNIKVDYNTLNDLLLQTKDIINKLTLTKINRVRELI